MPNSPSQCPQLDRNLQYKLHNNSFPRDADSLQHITGLTHFPAQIDRAEIGQYMGTLESCLHMIQ